MSSIVAFSAMPNGNLAMCLPAPFPMLLAVASHLLADVSTPVGPGALATVAADLAASDPLSTLEAEQVATELGEALNAARAAQDEVAVLVLAAAAANDGEVFMMLTPEQVLDLSAWANRLLVKAATTDLDDVQVGQGQSVFGDADLAALLGAPEDRDPTSDFPAQVDGSRLMDLFRAVAAELTLSLILAHREISDVS